MHIDITLPCYNPGPGWIENVVARTAQLRDAYPKAEMGCIIVNDGSHKGLRPGDEDRLVQSIPGLQWISYTTNRGKGFALRTGVRKSNADVILYTDIDFPYSQHSIQACLDAVLSDRADVALAIRSTSYYAQLPPFRRFISKLLRTANRLIPGMRTSDTQGGLKVFNRRGRDIFLQTTIDRYLFDLEFIYLASKQKDLRIHPTEAELREGVEFTSVRSGILLREGWNFLKLLMKSVK